MKKLITLIVVLLVSMICLGQDKIPFKYSITVHKARFDDTITLTNDKAIPNIPAPKVVNGSVFYNGEYLLNDVISIKINKISYYSVKPKEQSKYKITRIRMFNYFTGRYYWLNVITQPELQRQQNELNSRPKKYPFTKECDSLEHGDSQLPYLIKH